MTSGAEAYMQQQLGDVFSGNSSGNGRSDDPSSSTVEGRSGLNYQQHDRQESREGSNVVTDVSNVDPAPTTSVSTSDARYVTPNFLFPFEYSNVWFRIYKCLLNIIN